MKVYKLKDASSPGVVVVMIEGKISEAEHKTLTTLPGDLFLIFPEDITREIDPHKFAALYEATWYGIYRGSKVSGVWGALDYLESITGYLSVSVLQSNFYIDPAPLQRLQNSGIETSVFSSRATTKKEREKIYTITPKLIDIAFGFRLRLPRMSDVRGMYTRAVSEDPVLFLRPRSIKGMRESVVPRVLDSFRESGIGEFIASLIPQESYINVKIDEAKL